MCKKLAYITFFTISLFSFNLALAKETIYTDDVEIKVSKNNPYKIELSVNWENLPKNQFEYYKISHSTSDENTAYPKDVIWFSNDINNIIADENFSNYSPGLNWEKNYYRACVLTTNKIFCSKNNYLLSFSDTTNSNKKISTQTALMLSKSNNILSSVDLDYSSRIDNKIDEMKNFSWRVSDKISISFLENTTNISSFINKLEQLKKDTSEEIIKNKRIMKNLLLTEEDKTSIKQENERLQTSIDKINELLQEAENIREEKQSITLTNIKLSLFAIILIVIIIVISVKLKNRNKLSEKKENNKILQIIKNWNEYYVEYEGIYNKWVKVLESTKSSIKNWVENYVKAVQILWDNRWFLNELEKIDIEIPNLETYWKMIYKLFLNDEIKEKINHQTENLIIKTDEQEIPWEIMHNQKNFLSLKFPISRQIMTREKKKENKIEKNKIPKILFIINPTNNLKETETEAENIIKKILKKAEIKILKWNNANLINVIWEISKNNYDIIHYSWHSFFDSEKPDEWWLVLANQEILPNTEIKRLLWWNPLIFLNACYSWKSISDNEDHYKNTWEDTIWLASSFYIWGAKWVISSLWPIKDKKASIFATNFYLKFLSWKSVWNSLIYAKREAYIYNIKNPTWASFIYYWDPDFKINLK